MRKRHPSRARYVLPPKPDARTDRSPAKIRRYSKTTDRRGHRRSRWLLVSGRREPMKRPRRLSTTRAAKRSSHRAPAHGRKPSNRPSRSREVGADAPTCSGIILDPRSNPDPGHPWPGVREPGAPLFAMPEKTRRLRPKHEPRRSSLTLATRTARIVDSTACRRCVRRPIHGRMTAGRKFRRWF